MWRSPHRRPVTEMKSSRTSFNVTYCKFYMINWELILYEISSNHYRDSHHKDRMVWRPSYISYGNSYTGKTASVCWVNPMESGTCLEQLKKANNKNADIFHAVKHYLCITLLSMLFTPNNISTEFNNVSLIFTYSLNGCFIGIEAVAWPSPTK